MSFVHEIIRIVVRNWLCTSESNFWLGAMVQRENETKGKDPKKTTVKKVGGGVTFIFGVNGKWNHSIIEYKLVGII